MCYNMSWRYASIILDSSLYKCSGWLHSLSQQSIMTELSLHYFKSSIFNRNEEFTNDI